MSFLLLRYVIKYVIPKIILIYFSFYSIAITIPSIWTARIFPTTYKTTTIWRWTPHGNYYNQFISINVKNVVWNWQTSRETMLVYIDAFQTGTFWRFSNWRCKVSVLHFFSILRTEINVFWLIDWAIRTINHVAFVDCVFFIR